MDIYDTPIWQMTVRQLAEALKELQAQEEKPIEQKVHYVKGKEGLAKGLGVSTTTAQRLKNSGILNDAIFQRSPKSYVTDIELAKQILKQTYKRS